ncbi:MAG: hypothetical protein ACI8UO_002426, partial [Verrucomicrobiales bacterium]
RAITNQWLSDQGVPSIEKQWVSIRYPDGPKPGKLRANSGQLERWEPPGADPHAGWCGGSGFKPRSYPISLVLDYCVESSRGASELPIIGQI